MLTYLQIFKYNSLVTFSSYPLDIFIFALKRTLETVFLIIFWTLVTKDSNLDIKSMVSYFLITGGVSEIVMMNGLSVGTNIQKIVRNGALSSYIIKPLRAIPLIYFSVLGTRTLITIFSFLSITLGIAITNNVSLLGILFFIISLIIAALISLSFNIFLGLWYLSVNSISGINSLLTQLIKLLSGALIPLSFFPGGIKQILEVLPFSFVISTPALFLSQQSFSTNDFYKILIAIFWAIALNLVVIYLWNKALKKYEAYGI